MHYGNRGRGGRSGFGQPTGQSDRSSSKPSPRDNTPTFANSRPSFNGNQPAFGQKTGFSQNAPQKSVASQPRIPVQNTRVSGFMDQLRQEQQAGGGGMGYRGGPRGNSKYGNFSAGGREGKRSYNDLDNPDMQKRQTSSLIRIHNLPPQIQTIHIRETIRTDNFDFKDVTMANQQSSQVSPTQDCYVEFHNDRDAEQFMRRYTSTQKANFGFQPEAKLIINSFSLKMSYVDLTSVKGTKHYEQENVRKTNMKDRVDSSRTPCKVIQIKELDAGTDAATVRKTFEYVSKYPIIDVRFQKARFSSHQRGTAYVEFSCMQHAREVLTYLRNATPKFNINGKVVFLDYSDVDTDQERTGTVKVARGAGQTAASAGQWAALTQEQLNEMAGDGVEDEKEKLKREKKERRKKKNQQQLAFGIQQPEDYEHFQSKKGKIEKNTPEVLDLTDDSFTKTAALNKSSLPSMKKPNPALFQYDQESGYLFDPITGYYYDKPTNTYYDGVKQIWLEFNEKMMKFVEVENEVEEIGADEQQVMADLKEWERKQKKIKKEEEKKKKMISLDDLDRNFKKTKEAAQDLIIQDDVVEDLDPNELIALARLQSSQKISNFENQGISEVTGISLPGNSNVPEPEQVLVPDSDDINYEELVCNLCRRGFPSIEKLDKHVNESKLHKTNFAVKYGVSAESVMKQVMDPSIQKCLEITAQHRMVKHDKGADYRDRAAERREVHGSDASEIVSQMKKRKGDDFVQGRD